MAPGYLAQRLTSLIALSVVVLAAQPPKPELRVTHCDLPEYPQLARIAHVEGAVRVRVTTNGPVVVESKAEDGPPLLRIAAESHARTLRFGSSEPTSFVITYRYRLASDVDPNNPSVTFRLPTEVDVTAAFPRAMPSQP